MLLSGRWADLVMEGKPPEEFVARAGAGASWEGSFCLAVFHHLCSLHREFTVPCVTISMYLCVLTGLMSISLGEMRV